MNLNNITIPKYSKNEEFLNCLTHSIGIGLSIAGLIVGIIYAINYTDSIGIMAIVIYGLSLIVLYTMSSLYHGLSGNTKKIFRVIDHCSIFILISGTYTPYILISVRNIYGILVISFVWIFSILGIILNIIDIKKYSKISMICYLVTGWAAIAIMPLLISSIGFKGSMLLLAGGIAYTIGAVIYGIGKKVPYFHLVWHFCIIAGSVLQYMSILLYVIK